VNIQYLKPKPLDAFLEDIFPVIPFLGQWLLNFCVDIGVTLIHPLKLFIGGQQNTAFLTLFKTFIFTLIRYPIQLVLSVGSLCLNAIASFINNVFRQSEERALTPEELGYLQPVFGNSVNYDRVRLQFGGVKELLRISPQAVGHDIFIRRFWGVRAVYPDGTLTTAGLRLLGHEIAHVWQFQHTGAGYIGDSLITQTLAAVGQKLGVRLSDGYDLCHAIKSRRAIDECNVEQQAVMAELIGAACTLNESRALTLESFNLVSGYDLTKSDFSSATEAHSWFGH